MGFISCHIMPLVINSLMGTHTHAHIHKHTHTHICTHIVVRTETILRNQACASQAQCTVVIQQQIVGLENIDINF